MIGLCGYLWLESICPITQLVCRVLLQAVMEADQPLADARHQLTQLGYASEDVERARLLLPGCMGALSTVQPGEVPPNEALSVSPLSFLNDSSRHLLQSCRLLMRGKITEAVATLALGFARAAHVTTPMDLNSAMDKAAHSGESPVPPPLLQSLCELLPPTFCSSCMRIRGAGSRHEDALCALGPELHCPHWSDTSKRVTLLP